MEAGPKHNVFAEDFEDEALPSLRDLFRILWRRLWVIVLVAVVLSGGAAAFSLVQTPMYEASTKILVGQEQGNQAPGSLAGDVQGLQQITLTMAEAVNSRPVAEAVIRELDLGTSPEAFLENLSVRQVAETQFIQVAYTDPDPEQAREITQTIGETFSEQVSEVSPSTNAITATVWEPAVEPDEPVSPNPTRNGILALMLGLALGTGLALLLEYLDDSWRSPEELEGFSGVPNFGVVPKFEVEKTDQKAWAR